MNLELNNDINFFNINQIKKNYKLKIKNQMYLEQNSFFDNNQNNLTDRNISNQAKKNEIVNYFGSVNR